MKPLFISLLTLFLLSSSFTADSLLSDKGWILTKEKKGIKVYTRKNDSGLKEIRMTTSIKASIDDFMNVLNDTERYQEWVYKCSEARKTREVSVDEFFYYVELDFPFPASNRDLFVKTKQWIDSNGKYFSKSVSANDQEVVDDSNVRIKDYSALWSATPQSDGTLLLEYESSSDPGGNIPYWIVNLGITVGPLKSMQGVIKLTLEQ